MTKETERTHLAIFSGSWQDLDELDFSSLNLKFINLKNDELKKKIEEVEVRAPRIEHIFKGILKENGDSDRLQALIPIDFNKKVSENDIYFVRNILLLIFPSDITIHYFFNFELNNNKINLQSHSSFPFRSTGVDNMFDNYLIYHERELKSINAFIPVIIERLSRIKYAQSAFYSYTSSFFQNFETMEYLNLCIALESIVNGTSELNYRIRRNTSILLTSEVDFARNIFKNIGKIYTLRSKIVHSGKYKGQKIYEYLPYLRNVVSRLITEIISHNIDNLDTLNQILTEKGFGDNKSISENYVSYDLSSSVRSNALVKELE